MINQELQKRILSSIILIPLALFFIIKGSAFLIFFLSICFFITSFEWYMMSKKKLYNIPGHIFIIISFYTVYLVRGDHLLIANSHGILIIVLICIYRMPNYLWYVIRMSCLNCLNNLMN